MNQEQHAKLWPGAGQLQDAEAFVVPKPESRQVGGSHYLECDYQPWHAIEDLLTHEEFVGFLKGNLIKYAIRQGRKPGSDDAAKARHYAEKLREVMR